MSNGLRETDRLYPSLAQARQLTTGMSQEQAAAWLGSAFDSTTVFKNVASGAVIRFQFVAPELSSGFVIQLVSREIDTTNGPLDIGLYSGPTGVVVGAPMQQGCLRRFGPKPSVVGLNLVTSVATPGTLLFEDFAGGQAGGSNGKPTYSSGANRAGGIFVLLGPGSTTYYTLTNNSGGGIARVRVRFEWLQVPLEYLDLDGFI